MKTIFRFLLPLLLFTLINGKLCNENTLSLDAEDTSACSQTEYESYVECIRKRMKRSLDCESSSDECSDCDCNYCQSHGCESTCSNCCTQNTCSTHHCCHKTCSMQCRSPTCRKSCKKDCVQKITEKETEKVISVSSPDAHHNITTIIHLQNTINNTNLIDVPITVNNTNVNNITLESGDISATIGGGAGGAIVGGGGIIDTPKQSCCHLIGQRQCVYIPDPPYSKCFHVRSKHCGKVCHASTVHVQKHEICDVNEEHRQPSCREEVIYIPQPRPRCFHQQKWPYVSCGMLEAECGGCYAHHSTNTAYTGGCPGACFDDGYDIGPMYRQGPFYRPGYSAVPSCYQMGNCGGQSGYPISEGYQGSAGYPSSGYYPYGSPSYPVPESYDSNMQQGGYPIEGLQQPSETYVSHKINQRSTERNLKNVDITDDLPPKLVSIETKIEQPIEGGTKVIQ